MTDDEEKLGGIIDLHISALHLLAVHGNVCLGLRHPENKGPNRQLGIEFLNYAEAKLKAAGIINDNDITLIHKTEQEENPHNL